MQFHESLVPKLIFPSRKGAGFGAADVCDMSELFEGLNELDEKLIQAVLFSRSIVPRVYQMEVCQPPDEDISNSNCPDKNDGSRTPGYRALLSGNKPHTRLAALPDDAEAECLSFSPWLTFLLEPAVPERNPASRTLQLPLKKHIPFFCTDFGRALPIGVARKLGASVSDF